MNASWRRGLHRAARALSWTTGVLVIVLAISAALAQLLLPLLARHPQWVAAQLSARLHRPVSFESLEGRWQPSGPLFVMRDVTVGVGADGSGSPLHIPETELKLDFGGWLGELRADEERHARRATRDELLGDHRAGRGR